jgi:muconolactone delta-isomerase
MSSFRVISLTIFNWRDRMKMFIRSAALCFLLVPFIGVAQTPASNPLPTVPTTKILAIGRFSAPPTPDQFKLLASKEVPATVKLYLAGKIDQWYSVQNDYAVVFIMNVSSVEEAHALLEALPLGQAKLMTFQLIPMGPLSPLALSLPPAAKPAQ